VQIPAPDYPVFSDVRVVCAVFCTAPTGYPRVIEPPTLKAVEKDRHTVMTCSATGVPEPRIIWLKDFIPVDMSDPRLRLLPTGCLPAPCLKNGTFLIFLNTACR